MHLSDSAAQQQAEAVIVSGLTGELGVSLGPGGRIDVGDGAYVEVDAISEDRGVVVEAYARQGALKGAQVKKVGQDILKFALLRQLPAFAESRLVLAFASDEAANSIRGWLRRAASEFGVEIVSVSISDELRTSILDAQKRQVMINQEPTSLL